MLTKPAEWRSAYIVSPVYDWAFFLLPPIAALLIGVLVSGASFNNFEFEWQEQSFTPTSMFMGIFIHAHLVIVFFRSHGNRDVLTQHPWRFTLVPALLYAGMLLSTWVAVIASVLATFWDVYHSGAQTFGFGRIYDAKAGNDPHVGRKLDFAMNQLLYAGPIVAGATMLDHFEDFEEFEEVGSAFFTSVPAFMVGNHRTFTLAVLIGGAALVVFYVLAQIRFYQRGRNVSWQKVFIYASTGAVSIYTWGFNTFGEAFLIMNLFHAFQYFGIVWTMEKKNMRRVFRLDGGKLGGVAMVVIFVTVAISYGFAVEVWGDGRSRPWWCFHIVVSLMHFWYDGFIWSVRKKQTAA